MPMRNLQDALVEEMQDLLHAERQIKAALPRMAEKASNDQLRNAFEEHIKQTEGHIERLEQAFREIGAEAKAKTCEGIQGILKEGEELMNDDVDPDVLNAILIASAQKVEHYEIASYGTVCTWAQMLKHGKAADLLRQSLDEEKQTDERLTRLAEENVNKRAQA